MLDNLRHFNIVLASQSPRRQELLKMAGVPFHVEVMPDVPEDFPVAMPAIHVPELLAHNKMKAYKHLWSLPKTLVITSDTIVVLDGQVINKPANREEAIVMLSKLSGMVHEVITGVIIKSVDKEVSFNDVTKVWFRELSEADIIYYVDTFKPFDKAGSYGIQEWIGLTGIRKIDGSYFNVMGLPIDKLFHELTQF
jgi:septum formation protein